jgi:hypothetical protein
VCGKTKLFTLQQLEREGWGETEERERKTRRNHLDFLAEVLPWIKGKALLAGCQQNWLLPTAHF